MEAPAASNLDTVGVWPCHCDRANRLGRLRVEDWIPCAPVVVRLPHAAVHLTDVKDVRLRRHTGARSGAASAKWADRTPTHFLVAILGHLLCRAARVKKAGTETKKDAGQGVARETDHGPPEERLKQHSIP